MDIILKNVTNSNSVTSSNIIPTRYDKEVGKKEKLRTEYKINRKQKGKMCKREKRQT